MKSVLTIGAAALTATAAIAFWVLPSYLTDDEPTGGIDRYGTLGGEFTLTSIDGPVSLSDFEGEAVLLFFGFTHCPDYCLASLAVKRQALAALPEEYRGRVTGLFVSVDPDRDDVQTLADYTDFFHEDIIGITGDKATIDDVIRRYGGTYNFVDLPDSELDYTVEHSTYTYLIGPDGDVRGLFNFDTPYTDMVQRIQEIL